MGIFEYVSVLTSIIVGLSLAHLLQGVARLVQHPGRTETYWVHLVWVFYMLFFAVFWWWWEFAFASVESWTLQLYLFLLFYAVLIYLLCALLFPSDLEGYSGFEDYFLDRRVWFFSGSALLVLIDLTDTWMKGAEYFAELGWEYQVRGALTVLACFVAMSSKNRWFHGTFAVLSTAWLLAWAVRNFTTVA